MTAQAADYRHHGRRIQLWMPFKLPLSGVTNRLRRLRHWDRRFRRQDGVQRLTVVSQFFPPDFAATGQLLDDLTRRLADDGLHVQVLSGMPAYAYNRSDAEPVEFEPNRVIFRTRASRFWPKRIRGRAVNGLLYCLRTSLRLLKYARRGDLILYTTEPPYLPVVGWLVHQLTRTPLLRTTPYVLILYDLYPDVLTELGVLPERHWFTRFWRQCNRYAYRQARDVVVLSDAMRKRVEFFIPEVADRIHVIPSWADTERIKPLAKSDNWFVKKHGLEHTFNVLYSGNQGRCHDLVTLMGAALLLRINQGVRFVFIGGGPQRERIRELAAEWKLQNCLFLPYQDFDVLPYSLSCADLAIVSIGINADGLIAPSKMYGHLAAGTPVGLVAPMNSRVALVHSERIGKVFDNGDSLGLAKWINEMLVDTDKRILMSGEARAVAVECYSLSQISKMYEKILFG